MKRGFVTVLALFMALSLSAQNAEDLPFKLSGNLNAIYTLGNAARDQMLATGTGDGAYEEFKNGYFLETNLYALLKPAPFIEGYFKLYTIARPGSFYVPLSLETKSDQNFGISLDRMYGRVSVFEALNLSLPVDLFLKTGKYKGEAARYQLISKFGLENVLFKMETLNTYNYELEVALRPLNNDFTVSATFLGNYRFDEGIPRLYDVDGAVSDHGLPVLGEYAPQFMANVRICDLALGTGRLWWEFVYGQNMADIYSGHSIASSLLYTLSAIPDTLSVPIGLGFIWHEKNIDVLSRSASNEQNKETTGFRSNVSGALSAGLRFKTGNIGLDGNLAGVFTHIEHIYRDPLQIISASVELQLTFLDRYFIGGGIVMGTLADANWKTKEDTPDMNYGAKDGGGFDRTYSFADNFGYEIYGGVNLWNNCRFVFGFNQNKGIAMNYNLENKAEGQMKYQLADSDIPGSYETGGLFLKFVMNW